MPTHFKNSDHILIQIHSKDDWIKFSHLCDGYLLPNYFKKIYEYLYNDIFSIVLEKRYYDADYRSTYFGFYSHKFSTYPDTALRAHFFLNKIPRNELFELDRYQENYVGYTVIRPNRVSSIGRTVLDPRKLSKVTGYVCMAKFPVHILGAELFVEGFPYISQDTDVTVCAHAACWMIFRYFSQRYPRYRETWPYEVTQLTQDISQGRLVPSSGLSADQINEMFSNFGFYPEIYDRMDPEHDRFFNYLLYHYIESGLPVIAGIKEHSHAIVVIGHISNLSLKPKASTSFEYLQGLIVNDDNFMPYQVIGKKGYKPCGHLSNFKIDDIDFFIVPLYEKIHLSAEHVMKLSDAILEDKEIGVNKYSKQLINKDIITRVFLTSSKSYKKKRRNDNLPSELLKIYCEMHMPKFIWICEISTPDLFSKGKVIGEIIYDATASDNDRFSFLSIHYPDLIITNNRSYLTDDPKRFNVKALPDIIPYYPCYINNLAEA